MLKKGLAFLLVTYLFISLTGCGNHSLKPVYTVKQAPKEYEGLVFTAAGGETVDGNTKIGELFSSLSRPERKALIDSLKGEFNIFVKKQ